MVVLRAANGWEGHVEANGLVRRLWEVNYGMRKRCRSRMVSYTELSALSARRDSMVAVIIYKSVLWSSKEFATCQSCECKVAGR